MRKARKFLLVVGLGVSCIVSACEQPSQAPQPPSTTAPESPSATAPAAQPKATPSVANNRPPSEFSQEITSPVTPQILKVNEKITIPVTIKNTSTRTWRAAGENLIRLSYQWVDGSKKIVGPSIRTPLPRDLAPGESIDLKASVQAPAQRGDYILQVSMVEERIAWFVNKKGIPLVIFVTVLES